MADVTVCGTASTTVRPDFVVISLGLTHVAADAATALDDVAGRSQQLASLLARQGLEPADWVTDATQRQRRTGVARQPSQ